MNKILLLLFVLAASCSSNNITIDKEEYKKLKGLPPDKIFKVDDRVYKVNTGSDGHEYYPLSVGEVRYSIGIKDIHYPGCSLCSRLDSVKFKLKI